MKNKNFGKLIGVTAVAAGAAFVGLSILAKHKKADSVYENEPEQKNPLEGKQVVFTENEEEKENADGVRGHLEAVGESEYRPQFYEKYLKRGMDIALSFGGLVLLSPVMGAIALAIKIEDPGPVLFTQKRIGQNKQYFKLHKFRSMRLDTPHDVPTHQLENPDQYITKVGKFIRAHSLDELPQIWDIFIGNMSVIGPRPGLWNQDLLTAERDKYGANDVKPGLTGLAQINGRDELEIPDKAKLDGEYCKNIGLRTDAKVFLGSLHVFGKDESVVEGGTGSMNAERENPMAKEDANTENGKRSKILIITNHSYMLYQFRRELICELAKNHEVVLSMPFVGHEDDFKAMGFRCINTEVDRRGINPKTDLKLYQTYQNMLKKERPDLVITYSIKPNIYAGYACSRLGIPYCANVQGLGTAFQKAGLAQVVTLMYKVAFRKVRTVFFENETNAKEFRDRGIIPQSKQTVLHGAGINLEHYAYQPYPSNGKVHFLYLGRIMKEKGMDELFSSVRRLHADGENFLLDCVGFFEDEYKEQVEQLEAEGIVKFHGFQEEPRPYYAAADCVVLPSYHEGMSNVLLEAAATGRPIITSDIPGCREAVDAGTSGLLCEKQNADSLYKAMQKMLHETASERETMGKAGRAKMEAEFEKMAVVRETIAHLGI